MLARFAAVLAVLILGGAGAPATQAPAPTSTPAPPAAAAARSPRNASYAITARLDPERRMLRGEQLLTWRNTASRPAPTLQFHLYYNAWRNTRSTWMRERTLASGYDPLAARPGEDWGWIDITSLRVIRGGAPVDATARLRFIAPDDGNAEDRTVAEVPLDAPVGPGETITVQIAWTSRIPRTFARTGAIGRFYFLAQWFPKIGVFEDAGWNCRQFHSATEFFADFGVYDVRLTVPAGWIVGATGRERGTRDEGDGTTTHHYYEEDVHDFAWTTSPDYLVRTARFEHPSLPAVDLRLLLQPEHAGQEARHFDAARAALRRYGEWFGPYPYGHLTIVDPAWQSGADGMEYPTLITAGTHWLAPADVAEVEDVTIHETGHQFFYGIVATNEFDHAWMDEGITTFVTARALAEAYEQDFFVRRYFGGFVPWTFRDLPLTRETLGNRLVYYRRGGNRDVPAIPTWRYWPETAGAISYARTALWLHTLERMLGWETLRRILATYFERWAFRHPKPEDFFAIANEVSGQDLTWFFDEVHRSAKTFDYAIDALRSAPRDGVSAPGGPYRTVVIARRLGEGVFPVDVRVVHESGQETRWRWDGRDPWRAFEVEHPSRARSAQIDPDRVLLLDPDVTNNSASLEPAAPRAARKWSLAWLIWLQDHLLTYGLFI